jgi:hypothetical protein
VDLDAVSSASKINVIKSQSREQRITAVGKNGYLPHACQHVVKQLDAFTNQRRGHQIHSGNVAAGMRQASN